MTVVVVAQNTTGGRLRVAPNGDASAGDISWDASFANAAGSFTVPVNSDGSISVEVASATSVVMSLTGYWKTPTATDTGLGLHPLDAPERLVDTTTGTGACDDSACGRLTALSDTTIAAAGHAGIPADAADARRTSPGLLIDFPHLGGAEL